MMTVLSPRPEKNADTAAVINPGRANQQRTRKYVSSRAWMFGEWSMAAKIAGETGMRSRNAIPAATAK
jgi:hypothetical protein